MKTHVLFIQGGGDGAYDADAKLAASLREALGPDYHVNYPRMPDESDLEYDAWSRRIAEELTRAGEAVLVGHSIGASVIAKFLTEGDHTPALSGVSGVFLVATPFWHDHKVWKWKEAELPRDAGAKLPAGVPIFLYHGRDDETVPLGHVDLYAKAIPQAVVRRLPGRNHQLNDDLSDVARDIKQLR